MFRFGPLACRSLVEPTPSNLLSSRQFLPLTTGLSRHRAHGEGRVPLTVDDIIGIIDWYAFRIAAAQTSLEGTLPP